MESNENDLYAVENYYNTSGFSWSKIQAQYTSQPIFTDLVVTTFENRLGDGGDGNFNVDGSIDLSVSQTFYYTPGVGYVLKWGLVQYLSILVLVGAVLYPIYSIVVVNGLVTTFTSVDNGAGRKLKMY
jgi:hypothetical protein